MEKVKKDGLKSGMSFLANLLCVALMIICIVAIIGSGVVWIYGIVMHLVHGQFSEAFYWAAAGPMIMVMFTFFTD